MMLPPYAVLYLEVGLKFLHVHSCCNIFNGYLCFVETAMYASWLQSWTELGVDDDMYACRLV